MCVYPATWGKGKKGRQDSRIVGHGLEDGIVELNGPRNEQGGVRSLGRHGGRGRVRIRLRV